MTEFYILKFLHVIGATVLLGTGAGIAFFMLMAHRTGNVAVIAGVARIVVIADYVFTATAVVAQPVTGLLLARTIGYELSEGWIVASIASTSSPGCSGCRSSGCNRGCAPWRGRPPHPAHRCRTNIAACSAGGSRSAFPLSRPCY